MAEDLDPKLIRTKDMPIISQEIDVTLYDRLISTHQVTESTRATTGIPIGLLAQRFLSQDVIGSISSKNRFGTEVPDPDLGTDGDLYFRLSGETVHSVYVKLNGTWIILALGDDNWSNFLAGLPFDLISMDAESVAAYAFANNTSIRNVVMPSCLNVYNYGFASSSIKELQMENVEHIWPHAFEKCTGLTGLIDLRKCKYIDASAFESCRSSGATSTEVLLEDAIEIGDSAFYESSLFKREGINAMGLNLPNCTTIGRLAFGIFYSNYIAHFKELILPSIETIGVQAFRGITLSSGIVRIGKNCTDMGECPFFHAGDVQSWDIHIEAEEPPMLVGNLANTGLEDLVIPRHIYVPSDSVQTYKDNGVWGQYSTVIEAEPEEAI